MILLPIGLVVFLLPSNPELCLIFRQRLLDSLKSSARANLAGEVV